MEIISYQKKYSIYFLKVKFSTDSHSAILLIVKRRKDLAEKYLDTAWNAVKYLTDNHIDKVFLDIGIPYNRDRDRSYRACPVIEMNSAVLMTSS